MLLRVLYKHLIFMVEQGAVLVVDVDLHSKLGFDQLVDYIKVNSRQHKDSSGIAISCQIIRKALRGLRLMPKSSMSEEEKTTIRLVQNKLLEKFAQTFRSTTKKS